MADWREINPTKFELRTGGYIAVITRRVTRQWSGSIWLDVNRIWHNGPYSFRSDVKAACEQELAQLIREDIRIRNAMR